MPTPTVHWRAVPNDATAALSALRMLVDDTVSCQRLGSAQVAKICEGSDEIVLTSPAIGFGGVAWWKFVRRPLSELEFDEEVRLGAEDFSGSARTLGIWHRKSNSHRSGSLVPPTTIALMSTHGVTTKIVNVSSFPGLRPATMMITFTHALSGQQFLINQIMSIRAHASTLVRQVIHLATSGISEWNCFVILQILWDDTDVPRNEVLKKRIKDVLTHWRVSSCHSQAVDRCEKKRRITGKSRPSRVESGAVNVA